LDIDLGILIDCVFNKKVVEVVLIPFRMVEEAKFEEEIFESS
jgi:hypothetical protein